ncbi:hypothetical protein PAXRUDRAFT_15576 [Paxillus rubicundulus Ve08.2h10]|uniref:Uncharacterized protein n=1 Tax=Paxillus rubicundulus Ve08.2h10 TaxID=930991 RepID=A0A0D0CDQ0_9AGAM|nr:hypothetical protein PAXRUDRAFT_15576 [Paxillus rubicundulus Ve08.2h10]
MEEFSQMIVKGDPEAFCKSYISIRACGQDRYWQEVRKWMSKRTTADFQGDEEIEQSQGLIIVSPTRFGKTQWARSITPEHGYM